MKFLLASLKTFTNSEDGFESRITFLFRLSLPLNGGFSPVYIHGRLSENFQNHRRL